jgi:hypothetical protein
MSLRAHPGNDAQFVLRRRRPRPSFHRIALLSGILASGLVALSSTTVAFQDVASLYGKDLPASQRWLATSWKPISRVLFRRRLQPASSPAMSSATAS